MRSSIRAVAMGSSAEAGSSMRMTSGSTARQRAMHRRCCCPPERLRALALSRCLTSSQSAACCSARSTRPSRSSFLPEDARAEGDVVVDRLRERVRLLEDHADELADLDRVDLRAVEVEAVVEELALHLGSGDEVVHAVEAADERALAAARGPDHRRHLVRGDVEREAANGRLAAVRDLEVPYLEDGLAAPRVPLRRGLGQADWVGDRYHLFW